VHRSTSKAGIRQILTSPKLEQDLTAAIRFQGLLERFLELVERVHMLHCRGERSISYEVSQLLVDLLDLCAGRMIDGEKRRLMIAALRYSDTFVKIDSAWLFAERRLYVDWLEERPLS
jgi:hypothetical protein